MNRSGFERPGLVFLGQAHDLLLDLARQLAQLRDVRPRRVDALGLETARGLVGLRRLDDGRAQRRPPPYNGRAGEEAQR